MYMVVEAICRNLFGGLETIYYTTNQIPEGMSTLEYLNTKSEYHIVEIVKK